MSKTIKSLLLYAVFLAVVYAVSYHGYIYYYKVQTDQAPPPQAYLYHYAFNEPYIDGPEEFQQHIKNALATIKEFSPEQYEDICKYCVQIKFVSKDTEKVAASTNKSRIIKIYTNGYKQAEERKYALEQTLVHEAAHLLQYEEQREHQPKEQREAEALAAERKLLNALDVPPEFIEQVAGEHLLEIRWWEYDQDLSESMGRN